MAAISNEKLDEIELLAYRYMLKDEIILIAELNQDEASSMEFEKAFLTGRLKRKADFNGKLIALSDQLSSPAMNIENQLAAETALKDKLSR